MRIERSHGPEFLATDRYGNAYRLIPVIRTVTNEQTGKVIRATIFEFLVNGGPELARWVAIGNYTLVGTRGRPDISLTSNDPGRPISRELS